MKKIMVILGLMPILILMASIVNADVSPTCAFDQTQTTAGTASTYIKGASQNLSATITYDATIDFTVNSSVNTTMCKVTVSGGTIAGALTFNTTDGTNSSYCNTTVNTRQLVDTTTYTYTMTMYNESQSSIGTCTRTYITDNTIPVHSSPSPTTGTKDTDGKVTFQITATNASSANLYYKDVTSAMTESSDVFSFTEKGFSNQKINWYVVASDGLNSTTSSSYSIEVDTGGGFGYVDGQRVTSISSVEGKSLKGFINFIFKIPMSIINSIVNALKGA